MRKIPGLSNVHLICDLGYFRWGHPDWELGGYPLYYKNIGKATANEIHQLFASDQPPDTVIDINNLQFPIKFRTNLPEQFVANTYPCGNTGIGTLLHAKSKCDLDTLDFCLSGSKPLQFLATEKWTNGGRFSNFPIFVLKVPRTSIMFKIMRYGQ